MIRRMYIGIDGRPIHDQNLVNWDGKTVTEYDEHIIWKSKNFNPDLNHAIYTDRMWQADGVRYYAAVRTIWPELPQRQLFHDITPEQASLLLNLYFGYDIELTAILKGTHRMTGYPYWVFGYAKVEKPMTNKVTMRTVTNNYLTAKAEFTKIWQFPDYKSAEADIMALAKEMAESLNKNTTDGFRLDTDDDIYIVIQNHIAAIFYDIVPEPVATFDIFGLAAFTDKYNCHRWYYRGMWLYERTPGGRIYCVNKNDTMFWRKDIERALAHIDNLLLQKSLKEREKS